MLWLAINAIGAAIYLFAAARWWADPAASPETDPGGEAFGWLLEAVPVALGCAVLDVGMVVWAVRRRWKERAWPLSKLAWAIPILWLVVVRYEFAHH